VSGGAGSAGAGVDVVWCDFGGVLTPPMTDATERFARVAGVEWEELRIAIAQVAARLGSEGMLPLELGAIGQAEWGLMVEAALPVQPAIRLAEWDRYWYLDRPLDGDLLGALGRLRERGVAVGMLTNSVREWEPHRVRMLGPHAGAFDAVVRSHEVGLAKPDPRIFALADEQLPPGGGAMLIDDLDGNCRAARAFGWRAHLHRDSAETVRMLDALVTAS